MDSNEAHTTGMTIPCHRATDAGHRIRLTRMATFEHSAGFVPDPESSDDGDGASPYDDPGPMLRRARRGGVRR